MWGEEGRKEEREATVRSRNWSWNRRTGRWNHEWNSRIEVETVEQEDETVSETVEQKLKQWESEGGEGEGTKPETMNQNVGDRNFNSVTERKGIVTVKKHQVWQRDVVEKVLGVGLGFIVGINVQKLDLK